MGEKKQCSCCQRTKERTPEEYKKLIHRLKPYRGSGARHTRHGGEGRLLPDILVQSAAVTAAMNAFNRELLSDHIRTCVVDDIREGNDETIDELLRTLQKLMR